jgi:hypothetical protein
MSRIHLSKADVTARTSVSPTCEDSPHDSHLA